MEMTDVDKPGSKDRRTKFPKSSFFHFETEDDSVVLREVLEKTRREINEVPDRIREDIENVRKLLLKENVVCPYNGEEFILKFLRACKFDIEYTSTVIRNYYLEKRNRPAFHRDLFPSRIVDVIQAGIIDVLPNVGPDGRGILAFRCEKWNTSEFTLERILQAIFVTLEAMAMEERFQICGVNMIADMKDLQLSHVPQFTPTLLYIAFVFLQDWSPIRVESIMVIRHSAVFDIVFKLCRPFIRGELMKRIHFLGYNTKYLHERIPRRILPEYLDGLYVSKENDTKVWIKSLLDKEEQMREYSSMQLIKYCET